MTDDVGVTVYARVGGLPWFEELVERFYAAVQADIVLRPLYPADLTQARRHLALFLAQYWGGPPVYEAERGHPRLRRRHFPFAIGIAERNAWLTHMNAAVRAGGLSPADEGEMLGYFDSAATALVNHQPE
ncbi:MAG: globin [Candidatus Dormibacteria bacterium]